MTPGSIPVVTVSGRIVELADFTPDLVNAYDIAWGLHNQNRYNGQTFEPWDVLSHTGLVYMLYAKDVQGKTDPKITLAILLHDAPKAYMGDMVGHLKASHIGQSFKALEIELHSAITTRFGLGGLDLTQDQWALVDRYDKQAVSVEARAFFPELADRPEFTQPVYTSTWTPVLVRAKVSDYINALRGLTTGVETESLFAVPKALEKYLAAEAGPEAGPRRYSPDDDAPETDREAEQAARAAESWRV